MLFLEKLSGLLPSVIIGHDDERGLLLCVAVEYLIDHLEARKNELDEAIAKTTLPDTVSREFVNGLLLDIRKEQIAKYI